HLVIPSIEVANAESVSLLARCSRQATYARRYLLDEDLRQCLTWLYWAADALIGLIDSASSANDPKLTQDADPPPVAEEQSRRGVGVSRSRMKTPIEVVTEELDTAYQFYQYFTQRAVRLNYMEGIGYGMLGVTALFGVLLLSRKVTGAPLELAW